MQNENRYELKRVIPETLVFGMPMIAVLLPLVFYIGTDLKNERAVNTLVTIVTAYSTFIWVGIITLVIYLINPYRLFSKSRFDYGLTVLYFYILLIIGYASNYFYLFHVSGQFKGFDSTAWFPLFVESVYFSVVTLATVGYGDIQPVSVAAKWIVTTQILSAFILALFFAVNFPKADK